MDPAGDREQVRGVRVVQVAEEGQPGRFRARDIAGGAGHRVLPVRVAEPEVLHLAPVEEKRPLASPAVSLRPAAARARAQAVEHVEAAERGPEGDHEGDRAGDPVLPAVPDTNHRRAAGADGRPAELPRAHQPRDKLALPRGDLAVPEQLSPSLPLLAVRHRVPGRLQGRHRALPGRPEHREGEARGRRLRVQVDDQPLPVVPVQAHTRLQGKQHPQSEAGEVRQLDVGRLNHKRQEQRRV